MTKLQRIWCIRHVSMHLHYERYKTTMAPAHRAFSWTSHPATYPLIGALGLALSLAVYSFSRNVLTDPDITISK